MLSGAFVCRMDTLKWILELLLLLFIGQSCFHCFYFRMQLAWMSDLQSITCIRMLCMSQVFHSNFLCNKKRNVLKEQTFLPTVTFAGYERKDIYQERQMAINPVTPSKFSIFTKKDNTERNISYGTIMVSWEWLHNALRMDWGRVHWSPSDWETRLLQACQRRGGPEESRATRLQMLLKLPFNNPNNVDLEGKISTIGFMKFLPFGLTPPR